MFSLVEQLEGLPTTPCWCLQLNWHVTAKGEYLSCWINLCFMSTPPTLPRTSPRTPWCTSTYHYAWSTGFLGSGCGWSGTRFASWWFSCTGSKGAGLEQYGMSVLGCTLAWRFVSCPSTFLTIQVQFFWTKIIKSNLLHPPCLVM